MQKQPKFRRELLKFNQINKELNDIYDAFMRQEKMSHSEFDILYSLCELGKDVRSMTYAASPGCPNRR